MIASSRGVLEALFATAVRAAHPAGCLPRALPQPPALGNLILLAAGKAAGAMIEVAERHYLDTGFPAARIRGVAVARHGYGRTTQIIPVIEAGHPVPDAQGLAGAEQALRLAEAAGADDLVLVLLSGGASANWIAPVDGVSLADKQALTRALLRSGADIGQINTVRKHLSRIKGGRLARAAFPARLVTLAISDVPHDDPAVIGSGPTVPDPTTLAEARAILAAYAITPPASIAAALTDPANESPKVGDPVFAGCDYLLVARPADALRAAASAVSTLGYEAIQLGDNLEGEAREVAAQQAMMAREIQAAGRRAVLLSGGELTVTLRGDGRGGPNQEFALALAVAFDGVVGLAAISGDTDGTDGGTGLASDPAGAFVDGGSAARARALGLDPQAFLDRNDSTSFFEKLGDLLAPGPTFTNVNDFRAILITPTP